MFKNQSELFRSPVKKQFGEFLFNHFLSLSDVQTLLQRGSDPNENLSGRNGLHAAAESSFDSYEKIKLLLKFGTRVNEKDYNGLYHNTPLHITICNENSRAALFLMEQVKDSSQHIDYNITDIEGKTSLILAAKTRQENLALAILQEAYTQDPKILNSRDNEGRTALHYACALGQAKLMLALLEKGANPKILDNQNKEAIAYTNLDADGIIKILKTVSINPDRDEKAVQNIITDQLFQPLLSLIKENGTYCQHPYKDLTAKLANKDITTHIIASTDILDSSELNEGVIKPLSDKGKQEILKQFEVMTGRSLREAIIKGQEQVKFAWVQQGMPFGALIRFAAANNLKEDIETYLQAPNIRSYLNEPGLPSGKTALHYAAEKGHTELCQKLLLAGADPLLKDSKQCTPLMLAQKNKHHLTALSLQGAVAQSERTKG